MKKTFTNVLIMIALAVGVVGLPLAPAAQAIDVFQGACGSGAGGGSNSGNSNSTGNTAGGSNASSGGSSSSLCGAAAKDDAPSLIKNVINILLYLIGIIAVIAIIIGGIRYVTSNGDSSAIKSAKDTIMYAVIGLVVAIFAFAIVNFVVTAFK
ncbi:MAG: TrbC/VirB2 family protein [Candidatus Saccharimonadales bacterium]